MNKNRRPPKLVRSYAERVTLDPFLTPDWRWRRAAVVLAAPPTSRMLVDDEPTHAAVAVLRAKSWKAPHSPCHGPLVQAAAIYEADGKTRWYLEAVLLTGKSVDGTAAKLNLPAEVVVAYEQVFFDVRPRLHARDWVVTSTFGFGSPAEMMSGNPGRLWRWTGYHLGEVALDAVRDATTTRGRPNELRETLELLAAVAGLPASASDRRLQQLRLRLLADEAGDRPSLYHTPRGRHRKGSTTPAPAATTFPSVEVLGKMLLASHNGATTGGPE